MRAAGLTSPGELVFDEVYYAGDAARLLDGDFTSTSAHPPLGSWLIAAGLAVFGDRPLGWRAVPFAAGVATLVLTWLLARRLLGSAWWACLATGLAAADGLLVVQSRTAMLDGLLPPLLLGATLCALVHLDGRGREELGPAAAGAGLLLGAATAVKWAAAPVLAALVVVWLAPLARDPVRRRRAARVAGICFVAVPAAVYAASYAPALLWGGWDVGEVLERQRSMLDFHVELRTTHPYASSPWTWLLLRRPVAYFYEDLPSGDVRHILAVGNPVLWWGFLASLPVLAVAWWRRHERAVNVVLLAALTLYGTWLAVLRPQFAFYLTPLVPFMAIGVTWTVRRLTDGRRSRWWLPAGVAVGAAVAAAWLLPLWLGLRLDPDAWDRRILFDGWL